MSSTVEVLADAFLECGTPLFARSSITRARP